ncbi:peptidylprolyl isomerase [Rapidithrix thailandica]|uniref:peptidylprolyl isomerase n=1 Tax=Rapidithrix thailandica TaxID=413964 RepID=A0AAW9S690_9BACT
MIQFNYTGILLFCFVCFTACNKQQEKANTSTEEIIIDPNSASDYLVTIQTSKGSMKVILFDETPKHKANFLKLAQEGFYDDLLFHRVIESFMIQGGDPESKEAETGERLGRGNPGYTVPAEFHSMLFHEKGALSAARLGDAQNPEKESNGSQFFIVQGKKFNEEELKTARVDFNNLYKYFIQLIDRDQFYDLKNSYLELQLQNDQKALEEMILNLKDTIENIYKIELDKPLSEKEISLYTQKGGFPSLDQEYTVFGKVVEGLEIIDQIATLPTDDYNRPKEDIRFKVSFEKVPRKEIIQKYGEVYTK